MTAASHNEAILPILRLITAIAAADAVTALFGMIGLYAGAAALMAMLP